jgi:hypothetical protein
LSGQVIGGLAQGDGVFSLQQDGEVFAFARGTGTTEADAGTGDGAEDVAGILLELLLGNIPLVFGTRRT